MTSHSVNIIDLLKVKKFGYNKFLLHPFTYKRDPIYLVARETYLSSSTVFWSLALENGGDCAHTYKFMCRLLVSYVWLTLHTSQLHVAYILSYVWLTYQLHVCYVWVICDLHVSNVWDTCTSHPSDLPLLHIILLMNLSHAHRRNGSVTAPILS